MHLSSPGTIQGLTHIPKRRVKAEAGRGKKSRRCTFLAVSPFRCPLWEARASAVKLKETWAAASGVGQLIRRHAGSPDAQSPFKSPMITWQSHTLAWTWPSGKDNDKHVSVALCLCMREGLGGLGWGKRGMQNVCMTSLSHSKLPFSAVSHPLL